MNPLVYVLIGIGVLAVVMLILALTGGGGREDAQLEKRLDSYIAGEGTRSTKEVKDIDQEAKRLSKLTDGLSKAVEKRTFGIRIAERLAQASVKLTVGEYMILSIVSPILVGALAFLMFRNFLFLVGVVAGFFVPRIIVSMMSKQRLKQFNNQLDPAINLLVNGLRSGYSMLQAMEAVARDMPAPIAEEFGRVTLEIGLGVALEDALNHMLKRVPSDDLDLMITAINVQHEVGGNLAEILDIISFTIRERVRIKGEITALTAQGMLTGYVISGLPIALSLILFAMNKEYMGRMFTMVCGWIMLGVAVIMIASGFFVMMKIVQIEV
ncbi:MAG: type II secretion system F family protein [Anaerolineae bacterium]|nr:type II secretion system F family protein [Anaerolineae bacterium]